MHEEIILTPEQEKLLLDFWNKDPANPPSIKALTQELVKTIPELVGTIQDGRTPLGRAVKKSLARFNIKPQTADEYSKKTDKIILTDEQQQLIVNNVSTQTAVELARLAFNKPELSNLDAETRVVNAFIKTLDTKIVYKEEQNKEIPDGDYEPPNTLDKVFRRVNQYVNFALDKDKLTSQQKKGLEMLINYLHTYRFIRQINSFDKQDDRKSFEDNFIRYTYDKPDLTQEEVDQYIELSNQFVQGIKTSARKNLLEDRLADSSGPTDSETIKVSMGLVEAIGKAGTEYDQCLKRQQKLLEDLKEKRSTRLSKQIKENASILNLVTLWRDEEQRIKLIRLGELEQIAVAKEVEKLTNMSEVRARILGLDKDSILLE